MKQLPVDSYPGHIRVIYKANVSKLFNDIYSKCIFHFRDLPLFLDYYKFWLKSIDSFSDSNTQVIVVGTHADEISTDVSFLKTFS